MEEFHLTLSHISLLRHMVVVWSTVEAGAPIIDPQRPYGTSSRYQDIARLANESFRFSGLTALHPGKRKDMRHLHRQTEQALDIVLGHGTLAPGDYSYPNLLKNREDGIFTVMWAPELERFADEDIITLSLTENHLLLLKGMRVEWEELCGSNVPSINPKRPYGDMTFFEIDMVRLLGMSYELDDEGRPKFSDDQTELLNLLHSETQIALQIFLRNFEIEPGLFRRDYYGPWDRVSADPG